MIDPKEFGAELADIVKGAVSPLLARIDALEKAIGDLPEPPEMPDIPAMIALSIDEAVSQLPKPQDGAPGRDGADGAPGRDGVDGLPGEKGADGQDGAPGEKGEKGEPGRDGADGIGAAGAFIDRDGNLILTLTNGETKSLGRVVGQDGKDGADGFSFEDMTFIWREGKSYARFERGDVVREMPIPGIYDAGAYRSGAEYTKGDGVSYSGCFWIAQEDTAEKPGTGKAWRLAVKKGRDGKGSA